ncbi:MAG: DUF881 domain-containing protein [Eubacteriales bacterium]
MKKYGGVILVGFLALLIGLVISVQISTTQGADPGGLIPFAKAQGYVAELKKVRADKEVILQQLNDLEKQLEDIKKNKAEGDVVAEQMVADLAKYKMAAGMVDVKGPGVSVTIDDPKVEVLDGEKYSVIMYNYELLLSFVNKLKDAGAEAISINGQRIIATTEISLAGENVNINGVPTAPPYIIKAIGNPDTIESTLTIRFGIVEQMKSRYNLSVDINKSDEISIPRFSNVITFRYAKPVTE